MKYRDINSFYKQARRDSKLVSKAQTQPKFGVQPAKLPINPKYRKLVGVECHSSLTPWTTFDEKVERIFK